MPVVRISDATWERLKSWATPLEDTPDDALKKALYMADEHRRCAVPIGSFDNGRHPEAETVPALKDEQVGDMESNTGAVDRSAQSKRLRKGQKVTNQVYEMPILEVLYSLGGSAPMSVVLEGVEQRIGHLFGTADYQPLPSGGDIRWRNTAQWARNTLVHKRGLMKDDSPNGVWELTDEGVAEVKKRQGGQSKSLQ